MNLETRNLSVNFKGVRALTNVSIQVPAHGIVALLGANGAGKSTLLKSIAGLVKISSGEIWFKNIRIDYLPAYKISHYGIATVLEGRPVFRGMTVKENLLVGLHMRLERNTVHERLEEIWTIFPGLKERCNLPSEKLSGGEQQMLMIGKAIISGSDTLLLDEFSMGLAPILIEHLSKIIKRLHQERNLTILLAEQNVRVGIGIAEHIYVLNLGEVAIEGRTEDVMNSDYIISAYIGDIETR